MNRSELASVVLFAPLLYAAVDGLGSVGPIDVAVALGAIAAVLPLIGFLRPDLFALGWLPGFFLFVVLFTVSGITPNSLPGALGGLIGGWVAASPLFVGIAAVSARHSPAARPLLIVVALLTAVMVVVAAASGPYADAATFANAFVRLPRLEAEALATILSGSVPATLPFDSAAPPAFVALLLLGGAGALSGLLAVDDERPIEAIGFERTETPVPEGTYRSLFPEGRDRMAESTPATPPTAPELPSLASLLIAVLAGVASLVLAAGRPDLLLPTVAAASVALLFVTFYVSFRTRPNAPPAPTPPSIPVSAPKGGPAAAGPARL